MPLPSSIQHLSPHLIGFVRAYSWQLARGFDPELPTGSEAEGHQAALVAASAIVRLHRDKRDRSLTIRDLESFLGSQQGLPTPRLEQLLAALTVESSAPSAHEPVAAAPAPVQSTLAEPQPLAESIPEAPPVHQTPVQPASEPAAPAVQAPAPADDEKSSAETRSEGKRAHKKDGKKEAKKDAVSSDADSESKS